LDKVDVASGIAAAVEASHKRAEEIGKIESHNYIELFKEEIRDREIRIEDLIQN
jgi:hypothetical protein